LKGTTLILLLVLVYGHAFSQYYFTGEVDGLHGDKLSHVSILVASTGSVYWTGPNGDFAITSRQADDTIKVSYDGYEQFSTVVRSTEFLRIMLKSLSDSGNMRREPRLSMQEGPTRVSFASHSNGVSYHLIKRFLEMGDPVPAEAVKIEELLNYFNTTYEEPEPPACFHTSSALLSCPWNNAHRLLLVNISGRKVDMQQVPSGNLVLLIDVSGSMDVPDKLPLIKASLRPLINNLRATDTVSIVEFGTEMRVLAGIPGSAKGVLVNAIEGLKADGPSPGGEGLRLAYRVARHQFIPGGNNRIIFFSDGDICNSNTEARELGDYIGEQSKEGIALSCVGVGTPDSANQELPFFAQEGQGHFVPMEDEEEGEKALLKELSLGAIADNVSVTAEFDTTLGSGYRLIGFNNKPGGRMDTTLSRYSATSGESLMAVFEFAPKKDTSGVFAKIRIDYCVPGRATPQDISYDCSGKWVTWDRATLCQRRAVGVALFGMKLRGDDYAEETSWGEVQKLNKMVFAGANYIDREYLYLIARAKKIYEKDDRQVSRDNP
jgi:Ca-activated chloride channel family protein